MTVRALMLGMVLLSLAACTVPGKPYSYLDVRVAGPAVPTLDWPTPAQAVAFSVPIHSADNASLDVAYEVRDVTDPLTPVVVLTGLPPVTVPAFGDATISVDLGTQAAGIHTYELVLDPTGLLAERYEGNNIATVVIPVSTLDIAFGTPAPTVTRPLAGGDLTLDFAIANLTNPAAAPGPSDVSYVITLDGTVATVTPTSATLASPVTVGGGATVAVSVTVPDPGAGHTLTITLTSSVPERTLANDAVTLTVPGTG